MSSGKALRTSKNATMLLIGTVARMVASFAFVLYSASLLGVESFGKLSISIHIFELFLGITATSVGIILTRDAARWSRSLSSLLTSAVIVVLALSCLAPFVMISLGIVFGYSNDTLLAIGVACIAMFPSAVCVVFEAAFVARERAEFITLGTVVESLLRVVLSFLVLWCGYGIVELMWVVVLTRAMLLLSYWACLSRSETLRWSYSFAGTKRFVYRWRVFAAENWMATIYTNLDVLVLSSLAGEATVGLYSAAWKFVRLGAVFAKSFTTAVFPVMSRMHSDSKESFHQLFRYTIRIMCIIALPSIILVTVIPSRMVGMLYKKEYSEAAPILQILIWVLLLEFLNPFLSHVLFAQGKQKRSMYVAAISLGVNSIATFFLVQEYGARGAAIGCIVGGFVATLCYLGFSAKLHELPIIVLEIGRVLIAAACMGLTIYLVRDASWLIVLVVATLSYLLLLFLVGAIRMNDLRFLQTTFRRRVAV